MSGDPRVFDTFIIQFSRRLVCASEVCTAAERVSFSNLALLGYGSGLDSDRSALRRQTRDTVFGPSVEDPPDRSSTFYLFGVSSTIAMRSLCYGVMESLWWVCLADASGG